MIIILCIAGYIGIGATAALLYCLAEIRESETTTDRYFEDADNKAAALGMAWFWPVIALYLAGVGVLHGALWLLKFALKEIRKDR